MRPGSGTGAGEILQPLPGCVSLFLFYPGVRFAHPRLSSFRPAGAEYVTVCALRIRQKPAGARMTGGICLEGADEFDRARGTRLEYPQEELPPLPIFRRL